MSFECIVCERSLPPIEFYWRKDTQRHTGDCKDCRKGRAKVNYQSSGRFDRYGITKEEYDAQWVRQGRCCALCRTTDSGRQNGEWCIDHFHEEGHSRHPDKWRISDRSSFRGILCQTCNLGAG